MASSMPTVVLIGGNRRAGKNTFAQVLRTRLKKNDYWFDVFSKPGAIENSTEFFKSFSSPPSWSSSSAPSFQYTQASFAEILKENVAGMLEISVEEVESLKDSPMTPLMLLKCPQRWFHPPEHNPPTVRDVLIDTAARILHENKFFYAEKLFSHKISPNKKPNTVFLITDWRYKHEYQYYKELEDKGIINLFTIRVLNKKAPVIQTSSERDLDDFSPQFIARPSEQSTFSIEIFNDHPYLFSFSIC